MTRTTCDVCGAAGGLWVERRGRQLLRCPTCGFAWVPQGVLCTGTGVSIYEDEEGSLFESQADYYQDASARDAALAKIEWVARFTPPGRRLLDVGANIGHFVSVARQSYEAVGVEPSAAAVRIARAHGVDGLAVGSAYELADAVAGPFDAITMFDVIEHLAEPRRALEQCRRHLAPRGRLFLTTPDSGSAVARLLGARWHYLDLDQHISVFSAANLTSLLAASGFRVLSRRTFGRRYRFSYIERRLGELGRDNALLRSAHVAALPLRLVPNGRVSLNLHDVVGLVAEQS